MTVSRENQNVYRKRRLKSTRALASAGMAASLTKNTEFFTEGVGNNENVVTHGRRSKLTLKRIE